MTLRVVKLFLILAIIQIMCFYHYVKTFENILVYSGEIFNYFIQKQCNAFLACFCMYILTLLYLKLIYTLKIDSPYAWETANRQNHKMLTLRLYTECPDMDNMVGCCQSGQIRLPDCPTEMTLLKEYITPSEITDVEKLFIY